MVFRDKAIDILNVEWPDSDRDLNISIPVLMYLEKKYGLKTKTVSIFNAYWYLIKYRPRLLLISNFEGASINRNVVMLAYLSGVKVVSLISEGNVLKNSDMAFWGHNRQTTLFLDKRLVWNKRYYNFYKEIVKCEEYKEKVVVTGATGFDRYRLFEFLSKSEFLVENSRGKYKKVIGLAGWGFDLFHGDYFESMKNNLEKVYSSEQIDMHRYDMIKVNDAYKQIIINNPDILFIIRYHPGTVDYEIGEFSGINQPNVYFSSRKHGCKYKISDLINVCDLWIGYETTTALEAWLLDKPTLLYNPTTEDFEREIVHIGSPKCKTIYELQYYIDEYFSKGAIEKFDNLKTNRKKAVLETIGFDDGKNYIRAADEVIKVLRLPDRKISFKIGVYTGFLMQLVKMVLSKSIFKERWPELKYKANFADEYRDAYYKVVDS